MSVIFGKADRFKRSSRSTPRDRARGSGPPLAYSGLRSSPQLSVEYEPNETAPIEGQIPNNLTPFTLRVEPPFIFGDAPDSTNDKGVSLYSNALRKHGGYENARRSIPAFGFAPNQASAEQVISKVPSQSAHKELIDGSVEALGPPAIADLHTAVDVSLQLQAILDTPPLTLLINPQSLSMSIAKIQQFQDRTRYGYVFQAWGEEQPTLTISARCGAFYSAGRGVQYASKQDSAAWQNLMNAFALYRHNGYIYDTLGSSNANLFVGVLSITYDDWVYYGNMSSFSYTEDTTNQLGGVVFEMAFSVSHVVDVSQAGLVVTPQVSGSGVVRSTLPSTSSGLPEFEDLVSRGVGLIPRRGSGFSPGADAPPPVVPVLSLQPEPFRI